MARRGENTSDPVMQETQFAPLDVANPPINDEERLLEHGAEGASGNSVTNTSTVHLSNKYGSVDTLEAHSIKPSIPAVSIRALAPDLLRGTVMVLQSIDHSAVSAGAYSHGQALVGEEASKRVDRWNEPVGYTARLFTHLCAPGFMFLLGMGVVYLGRSRQKLGWGPSRLLQHFFVRAVVLILVNQALSIVLIRKLFPVLNIVLLALAFVYLFAGLMWLAMSWTEPRLAELIVVATTDSSTDSENNSLLHTNSRSSTSNPKIRERALQISFHIHNGVLLILSAVTLWWNIWLDPYQGHCPDPSQTTPQPSPGNFVFEFFFHEVRNPYLFSGFPPLAWLSPALLGLLYGRIISSRSWKPLTIALGNLATAMVLGVLFLLTRFFQFGNLDQGCLAMPEHLANPSKNQYLVSVRSFFYITKYPPSPSYMFFAMGSNFTLLALYSFMSPRVASYFPFSVVIVFGTSALFFYVVHMILYFSLGTAVKALFGHQMDYTDPMNPGHKAWGIGSGPLFWFEWLFGLAIMWPLCRWYGRFKAAKGPDSIWRFF